MSKAKQCPKCGGEITLDESTVQGLFRYRCTSCGYGVSQYSTTAFAARLQFELDTTKARLAKALVLLRRLEALDKSDDEAAEYLHMYESLCEDNTAFLSTQDTEKPNPQEEAANE